MESNDTMIKIVIARGDGESLKQEFVVTQGANGATIEEIGKRMMKSAAMKWEAKTSGKRTNANL